MEQLLSEPSIWFGFLVITAAALLPDMAFTTLTRYYYRTKTQVAQVCNKVAFARFENLPV